MLVASMQDVHCSYGTQTVLSGASFRLSSGERLGLIGRNGAGKTTILRLLLAEERPSSGLASISKAVRVGYVPQHVEFEPGETALDCVLRDHRTLTAELRLAEDRLSRASEESPSPSPAGGNRIERALAEFQSARDAYDAIDGDRLPQRAEAMLDGLGLAERAEQPVEQLSGGEKVVVAMARALLTEPDLLVLDEPGNHLDHQGLDWLIDFLGRFQGSSFLVSHNRYLLDRVVDGILELEGGALTYYDGGYSSYRSTKLRNLLAQQADYVANQKRLAQLEALVQRFVQIARVNSDKSWGKRLRARRSQLERERGQAVEKPVLGEKAIRAQFAGGGSRAQIALRIRGYTKAYGDKVLLENAELDIDCGERVALVGPNGCGKTSLLRDIVIEGSWDAETIRIGPSLTVGYGSQEKEADPGDSTVLSAIKATGPMTDGQAFSLLSRLNFGPEDIGKRIDTLSGGERNRLQLARLMATRPSFLILDEPTNHLDISSREVIEEALQDFQGTLLVVSHDRYFLEKVATRVVEFGERRLRSFPGPFGEYWQSRRIPRTSSAGRASKRRQEREATGTAPMRVSRSSRNLANVEAKIEAAEAEKVDLETRVAAAFGKNDVRLGQQLQEKLRRLESALGELYQKWEAELG